MNDALEVSLRLLRAQAMLVKRFDHRLSSLHGVSFADLTLMLQLGRADGGRMRRVDLAQALGLSASGVTRGLVPLERIGLVMREADPRDARVAYAALTSTGRRRLVDMEATAREVAAEVFGGEPWQGGGLERFAELLALLGESAATRRRESAGTGGG